MVINTSSFKKVEGNIAVTKLGKSDMTRYIQWHKNVIAAVLMAPLADSRKKNLRPRSRSVQIFEISNMNQAGKRTRISAGNKDVRMEVTRTRVCY